MMSDKDLLLNFLNNVKADIITDLKEKRLSDGDLGMRTKADETSGELSGYEYYYYLVHGRRPGKRPPMQSILDWIRKKGIQDPDITERSLAYIIARKIGLFGTDIYQGKREGLALEQIIKHNGEQFKGELGDKYLEEIKKDIGGALRSIFNPKP